MRNKKIKIYCLILSIIIIFSLVSCASKPKIQGRWLNIEDKGTIEFRKDGTFVGVDNMGATFKGNYLITNGNIRFEITHTNILRETIQPEIPPEVVNARISINEDELHFMFKPDGKDKVKVEKYKREIR